ncbi:MAG: gliding motility lipoprotein GldH [Bacteroidia bacterium]|nr:gliding motility lipoprotein GldH [Bacteroidia bacterium]
MTTRIRLRTILQRPILKKAALFYLAIFLLSSCNNNVVYSKYQKFNENEWYAKDKAVFDLEITDTLTLNNISLMVRHADAYPYRNLFVFVTTKYPDGKVLTDTMEVILSDDKGKWQGSGAGDIFDFKVPIKKNVRFPLAGKYQFSFEQGMRVDPLPLIMDFGFEIEKSKK